jgi:N-methylhydantoinase A
VRRGYDPRECALVAFGGAGPLHACEIAEELEIPTILVPPSPGITSAMGLLTTDLRYDNVRTVGLMLDEADRDVIESTFAEMEAELRERLEGHEGAAPTLSREAACRYAGQGYELAASCDSLGGRWRDQIAESFHERHRHEYGFEFRGDPIELINLRVIATAEIASRPETAVDSGDADPAAASSGSTRIVFGDAAGGAAEVPAYERVRLLAGNRLEGPAVVHEMDSTVVVSRGWAGEVLGDGTLRLSIGEGR